MQVHLVDGTYELFRYHFALPSHVTDAGRELGAALREAGGAEVPGGDELPTIVDLLVTAGLSESRGAARRTVSEGGAYLNNGRVTDPEHRPTAADLVADGWLVLRRGKKSFAGVRVG